MDLAKTLLWYGGNIWGYTLQMLPCMSLALAAFFLLRPHRRRRLEGLGLISTPRREGAMLLFLMFCAGLAALTLFPAGFWRPGHWGAALRGEVPLFPPVDWYIQFQTLQTTPFQEIRRAFRGPWVMFLMVANIGIFCPVGFFSALLWSRPRWWKSMLTGFAASCAIETIQFFIGRSTDVDDIILNTTGALAGFWLFWLLRALFPRFCSQFQCQKQGGTYHG